MPAPIKTDEKRSLRERFAALFTEWRKKEDDLRAAATAEELSDMELRSSLDRVLMSTVPAFLGIDAVFPGENSVVYATATDQGVQLFRVKYSVAETGEVTLKNEPQRVQEVRRYEPVAAAEKPCGCNNPPAPTGAASHEDTMKIDAARIKALIDNPKSGFIEADRAALEVLSEGTFAKLEAAAAKPAEKTRADRVQALIDNPKTAFTAADRAALEAISDATFSALESAEPAPAAAPKDETQPVAPVVDTDPEKLIQQLPTDVQKDIAAARAARGARKTLLVSQLKALNAHTEAELNAMDVEGLEKLAKIAKVGIEPRQASSGDVLDFAGRGTPRAASDNTDNAPPKPTGMVAAVRAAQKSAATH